MLKPHERARSGDHPGLEHEFAVLTDTSKACNLILSTLQYAWQHKYAFSAEDEGFQGWESAETLRALLQGGYGPRRARQLRDEYGYPIEVERRSKPSQAWYRLMSDRVGVEA